MTRLEQVLTDLVAEVRAMGARIDALQATVTGCQRTRDAAAAVAEAERTEEVARAERTWGRITQVAESRWVQGALLVLLVYGAVRLGVDPTAIIPVHAPTPIGGAP